MSFIRRFLNLKIPACRCGSGGHPRRCVKHPWTYQQHIADLNHYGLLDHVEELEKRIEELETKIGKLESLERLVDQIDKVQNMMLDK